ncbi:5-oxoprolinase subunit PxpB [Peribacillus acanthi]|uniref:5-oxoprolinase subunit PxpB n=1 Tax=Peribacillus acanthi TaxID=2171554 RepID=UPI000D3EDA51|nr:5-oxoprolinase subunit PxpB [Peribacillus acanthi]
MEYTIEPLNESSILIIFTNQNYVEVQKIAQYIALNPFKGYVELVPAYNTITVYYNPFIMKGDSPFSTVTKLLCNMINTMNSSLQLNNRYFEIPVCYENDFGLDLQLLAESKKISINEIIHLHSQVIYDVIFIGFSPGFPFLSGLDQQLHSPRKTSPRIKVPQGSVGVAGNQTGIYPLDSPGGWQIIGRTPIRLFDIHQQPSPTLLKAGDQVKFYPISRVEFDQWENQAWV